MRIYEQLKDNFANLALSVRYGPDQGFEPNVPEIAFHLKIGNQFALR